MAGRLCIITEHIETKNFGDVFILMFPGYLFHKDFLEIRKGIGYDL
jgi:hypothetical protein